MPTSAVPVSLSFADADARLGGVLSAEFDGAGPAPGGFANVLFFDGDLTLEGDFLPAVAELLGADAESPLEMVVVTGDLTVNGCIAIYEDRPALYVGGYTRAETLEGGDAEIHIHDGAFTHFVYGWYNHGSLEAGMVDTPWVIESDHEMVLAAPGARWVDNYGDHDDVDFAFGNGFGEAFVPEVLDEDGRLDVDEFLNQLRAGLPVLRPGARSVLESAAVTVAELPLQDGGSSRICGVATRLVQINMKAQDDSALGRFWAEALGWGIDSEGPGVTNLEPLGFAYPDPVAVCIDIIADPEPKTVKNRVHVDLATSSAAHQAELVARLKDLGATLADVGQGDVPWTVMADPEGNEFCVLEPRAIYQDLGPIAAVVVDCADPREMARFWGEAMDWTVHEVADDHASLRSGQGVGPYLEFVRNPDAKVVWNRVHLDIAPYRGDDLAEEEARLRALGATDPGIDQSAIHWRILSDPENNEFCLLTPR